MFMPPPFIYLFIIRLRVASKVKRYVAASDLKQA